jgi:hypothetical protein
MPDRTPSPDGSPAFAQEADAAEIAALLDALMAQPIKRPPQITVFGDEDVVGINPAPIHREP